MFGRSRKKKLDLKPEIYELDRYPTPRNCSANQNRRPQPNQMPPLMVRKPEWRR